MLNEIYLKYKLKNFKQDTIALLENRNFTTKKFLQSKKSLDYLEKNQHLLKNDETNKGQLIIFSLLFKAKIMHLFGEYENSIQFSKSLLSIIYKNRMHQSDYFSDWTRLNAELLNIQNQVALWTISAEKNNMNFNKNIIDDIFKMCVKDGALKAIEDNLKNQNTEISKQILDDLEKNISLKAQGHELFQKLIEIENKTKSTMRSVFTISIKSSLILERLKILFYTQKKDEQDEVALLNLLQEFCKYESSSQTLNPLGVASGENFHFRKLSHEKSFFAYLNNFHIELFNKENKIVFFRLWHKSSSVMVPSKERTKIINVGNDEDLKNKLSDI